MQPTKCLSYVLCLAAVLFTASHAQTSRGDERPSLRHAELQRALTAFASWARRQATKTGAVTGSTALEEGVRLAKQRRAALQQLIESHPALASASAIPASSRNALPARIQDELEEPVSGTGDLLVLCAMPVEGVPGSGGIQRLVRLNGRTYRAAVYGRRLEQTTKYRIPLHGIALDGVLALDPDVLEELQSDETVSVTEPIHDLSPAGRPLAASGPPVLAKMGGQLYRFASAEHLRRSEAMLEAAESGARPEPQEPASGLLERIRVPETEPKAAPLPRVAPPTASKEAKALVIRADFSDLPGDPRPLGGGGLYTAAYLQAVADGQVAPYYQNSSYGNATVSFTVTPQLYRLPGTASHYSTTAEQFQLYDDAVAAAQADYAVTNYDKVIVVFSWLGSLPNSQLQFGGLSLIGTSMVWVNGEFDFRVVAHELGHTYGLYHANFWHTADLNPVSDNGWSTEYADLFDAMGANWPNDRRADFNPWFKYQLGWIKDAQVQTVTQSGVYRVYRFDDALATGTLALKIAKDSTRDYWVGFRRNYSENSDLQHGAYVLWGYHYARQSNLLGLGQTINNQRDPGLALGTALADPQANLTILPMAQGGAAPNEYLDVEVVIGPPPVITQQPDSLVALEGFAAQFNVGATGNPGYAWQRQIGGAGDWFTLGDGSGYEGANTPILRIRPTSLAMDGDAFRCLLTNSAGGFNCSQVARLTVNSLGIAIFAGQSGISGQSDGAGEIAQFNSPMGIALDHARNVYVADTGNHTIRKISPAGQVSSLAGLAGNRGSADGPGAEARFDSPMGLAVDAAGNVFVADSMNSTIRQISPEGEVTTLAGLAGVVGATDGVAADARFNHPAGLAIDCFGNIFVADTGNDTVRVITASGAVITLAGQSGILGAVDGVGSSARFNNPSGIAVDFDETIYVADQGNSTIRKITVGGVVNTLAGMAGVTGTLDGSCANARFNFPAGLAVDVAGNVYVADRNDSTIREISPAGAVSTLAGISGTNGIATGPRVSASFSFPSALAVDSEGMVFVADTYANTIRLMRSAPPLLPPLRMSVVDRQLILSWPASAEGYRLESRPNLSGSHSWTVVPSQPTVVGCNFVVTNTLDSPTGFFRLHEQ